VKAEKALSVALSRAELAEARVQESEASCTELQQTLEQQKAEHTARLLALTGMERDNELLRRECDELRMETEELYRRCGEMRRRQVELEDVIAEWRRRRGEEEKSMWEKVGVRTQAKTDWNRNHHIVDSRVNVDVIPAKRRLFTTNSQSLRELERQAGTEAANSLQMSVQRPGSAGPRGANQPGADSARRKARPRSATPSRDLDRGVLASGSLKAR
jgi:hypothetical protein